MTTKKIKILYIISSLRLCDGVTSYSMNYYRGLNKEQFEIDFIVYPDNQSDYYNEIRNNGGKIYYISKLGKSNIKSKFKEIDNFFAKNKYDIVHCHILTMGAIYLYYAKKHGVKIRILHSHATKFGEGKWKNLRNSLFAFFSLKFANVYYACSKAAGDFLFKDKKYEVINNAINIAKFKYDKAKRDTIRKKYGVKEDEILIGKQLNNIDLFTKASYSYELGNLDKNLNIEILNNTVEVKNNTMNKESINFSIGTKLNFENFSLGVELGKEFGQRDKKYVTLDIIYKF